MVLLQEPAINDLPALVQGVGAGIDQRLVFQVLVLMPGDRIDRQERALDRAAALGHDLVHVEQVLPGRWGHVVE